ncbi:DUF1211 domain-containing protein [Weissella diestrammenae]|uniref:DUF1211 domain-containing protein n=1 Tax=Weissella diestrammenae TaxID=1162633 RepID=A0A7G9T4J3_9LACO|nr:TMEM175 family protein [Weissella diestrammenae]MCM0582043.1 DUF1211 domain-containing protein [Weissella diestrammenae]QNN75018.1 DUF1211 domain-containing protein [Weissella diestrammenae]
MNKGRVEAFTDAVIAIVLTIMVLELKVPEGYTWHNLAESLPNFIAYLISFIYILVAWYNHHYMFGIANKITKKIFWANNLWMFTSSLFPVSTAWFGKYIMHWQPAIFYLIIYAIWLYAYLILSKAIASENDREIATMIYNMPVYKLLSSKYYFLIMLIAGLGVYVFPPIIFGLFVIQAPIVIRAISSESDQLFND